MQDLSNAIINQIYRGIAKLLKELFPDVQVNRGYPEQGLEPPCFVVRTTGGNNKKRISNSKYKKDLEYLRFTIEFYSFNDAELDGVMEELRLLIDTFDIDDGPIRAYNLQSSKSYTANRVTVSFNIVVSTNIYKERIPSMDELDIQHSILED